MNKEDSVFKRHRPYELQVLINDLGYTDALGRYTEVSDSEMQDLLALDKLYRAQQVVHIMRGMKWMHSMGRDWTYEEVDAYIDLGCSVIEEALKARHFEKWDRGYSFR